MLNVRSTTFRSVHQLVGTMVLLTGFSYSSVVAADPATSAFDHPSSSFWSFQAPKRPAIPAVRAKSWPSSPIDSFVLAKLEAKGIHPARAADRRTLIRRATVDLIGLPPTPEEVDTFCTDESPDAFGRGDARLLARPPYGEGWGRYWLDIARYADTKGYVYADRNERRFVHAYTYRDWVVRSFAEDLPYDQFLIEQLAADLLPERTDRRSLAALGFLTLGQRFLSNTHDIIDDRIDVVTRGMQGLTVTCARCHDHKYDPIPTADYYSLYGVFASSEEKIVCLVEEPERTEEYVAYEKELVKRKSAFENTVAAKCKEASKRLRAKVADYLLAVLDVESLPTQEVYESLGADDLNPIIVRRWQSYIFERTKRFDPIFSPWRELAAFPEIGFANRAAKLARQYGRDAERRPTGLAPSQLPTDQERRLNPLVAQLFAGAPPASMREVVQRYARLFLDVEQSWQKASKSEKAHERLADPVREAIRQVLYGDASPVVITVTSGLDFAWLFDDPTRIQLSKLQADIERWQIKSPAAPPHATILRERPRAINPRIFRRGHPGLLGASVPRQFVGILAGKDRKPFRRGSGRLELARAIASRNNPLTARVIVNRIWSHHFGAGLVRTESDFGTRCDGPSHPQLLDFLANWFMDEGWSIKRLHRLLMLSSTYRQAGENDPRYQDQDPENRLLWKMIRRRLDFEALRDSLLAVSGDLDHRIGGPPVNFKTKPHSRRRTIYGDIDRQNVPGMFLVFDFANPEQHTPKRSTTTVAQQALFMMNSPFVMGRARVIAERLKPTPSIDERIRSLYASVFQRPPTANELDLGRVFIGASPGTADSWQRYAQVLLLSNEFMFVD
jgi:hypothetical protein